MQEHVVAQVAGPGFWFGVLFAVLGVLCVVWPFASRWRYRRFAARSARVGGHVLEMVTERVGRGDHTSYVHRAQVAYEAEDGRRFTKQIDVHDRIEVGAELWLLHDRVDPEQVELEQDPRWLGRAVAGAVLAIALFSALAYLMFAVDGLVPDGGLLDRAS